MADQRSMRITEPNRTACRHALAADVLQTHGRIRIAAYGLSMLPSLWPGDVLTVEQESLDSIAEGEIALFERHGQFVAHRVVRRNPSETHLVTRGDALQFLDEPVSAQRILGRVILVERGGRRLNRVPVCSRLVRGLGLVLNSCDRLRSVALRWYGWRHQHSFKGRMAAAASPIQASPLA